MPFGAIAVAPITQALLSQQCCSHSVAIVVECRGCMRHGRRFFQSGDAKSATVVSLYALVCFVCDSKFGNWYDVIKNISGYRSSIADSWFVTLDRRVNPQSDCGLQQEKPQL